MGNSVSGVKGKHAAAAHFSFPDLPSDAQVTEVKFLLRKLGDDYMNFVRGVENFFTGGNSHRTFESWNTHFAIELYFDGERLVVERTEGGVLASKRERTEDEIETEWLGASEMEDERVVTLEDVKKFCEEQGWIPYSFLGKNCKHFAYDFYQALLGRPQGRFEDFCGRHEAVWRAMT